LINNIQTIFQPAGGFLQLVSKELDQAIENIETSNVKEMLKYGMSQKGQMIRPSLIYFIAKALKQNIELHEEQSLVHLACAVELLHTASLVHDDIIDSSEFRRGKESIYKRFGSGNAVLTGNTFYLLAFDLANKNLSKPQVDSIIRAASDMCCGEVIQQLYNRKLLPHAVYFDIIAKKTSSIIKHACKESAGIIGVSSLEILKMQELGECLGMLYQLSDDYKDKDVNLEPGFNFKLNAYNYINKADTIIKSFNESIYKKTFEIFLVFLSQIF
jgi:octaprenyl-diphosphate synthase